MSEKISSKQRQNLNSIGIESDYDMAYEDEQPQKRQRKRTLFLDEPAKNDVILRGREKFIVGTLNVECDKNGFKFNFVGFLHI